MAKQIVAFLNFAKALENCYIDIIIFVILSRVNEVYFNMSWHLNFYNLQDFQVPSCISQTETLQHLRCHRCQVLDLTAAFL